MIAVSYIFVGVMPRTIGRQHSVRVALAFAGPLALLQKILGPLAQLLIVIGNAVPPFRLAPEAVQQRIDILDFSETVASAIGSLRDGS